ncbi:MAG: hypothetical protein ABI882_18265 [Acidobacteriota bacterium]
MPTIIGNHDQAELIALAIAGIDAQVRELQEKRASLAQLATAGVKQVRSASARTTAPASETTKKRVFSAATRKRLSLAAKRRWARTRAAKKGKGA